MKNMSGVGKLHMVTFLLLIIGGLNWLLVGLVSWDIGSLFGGMDAVISRIIYVLVGLAAIVEIASHKQTCTGCGAGKCESDSAGSCACGQCEGCRAKMGGDSSTSTTSTMGE